MYSRHKCFQLPVVEFQSTRLSRASTSCRKIISEYWNILIHKALTSLDNDYIIGYILINEFQSTRLSRASTKRTKYSPNEIRISIHKALTSLDQDGFTNGPGGSISIHTALTSLDKIPHGGQPA